ncbi:MAG: DUF58 domain-containing protein [Lachnospiraceae bacterium]
MVGRKILYFFLLYMVLVYNVLYKTYDAYVLLIAAVAVPVVSLVILIIQKCFVRIHCKENFISTVRLETAVVKYEVNNPTPFPVAYAEAVLQERKKRMRFSVPARNKAFVNNTVSYEHCGVDTVQLRCVYIYDFLRLFRFKLYNPGVVKVTILPRLFGVSEGEQEISTMQDDSSTGSKKGNDRSEIAEIREYRDGDCIRDIHQKLSCRMSRLMVKIYSCEEEDEPAFLFWPGENGSEQKEIKDRMLEAMYTLMNALLAEGQGIKGIIPENEGVDSVSIRNNNELDSFFVRILNKEDYTVYIPGCEIINLHIFAVSKSESLFEFMNEMHSPGGEPILYIPVESCDAEEKDSVVCVSMSGGEQICFDYL